MPAKAIAPPRRAEEGDVADTVEVPETASAPEQPPGSGPPPWLQGTITRSIWTAVGIVLLTLVTIWFANQARSLIRYLLISLFLALALEPAVNWFHEKRGWRRGSATGLLLAGLFLLFVVLGATVVPILVSGVNGIAGSVPTYIRELNDYTQRNFHTTVEPRAGETLAVAGSPLDPALALRLQPSPLEGGEAPPSRGEG